MSCPPGLGDGLGRSLLTFSYYYISGPEKLYAAIIVSALLGITFVSLVAIAESTRSEAGTAQKDKSSVFSRQSSAEAARDGHGGASRISGSG